MIAYGEDPDEYLDRLIECDNAGVGFCPSDGRYGGAPHVQGQQPQRLAR